MRYVSIDIETLGLDEQTCDTIELGAVVDDLSLPADQQRPKFHCYILPPGTGGIYKGQPYAMSMHPTILRRIATREAGYDYISPEEVASAFGAWPLSSSAGFTTKDRVTASGKNYGTFDSRFLGVLPGWHKLKMHHRVLDPGSMYFTPGVDKVIPDTKECMRRAGIDGEVAHTSIEDALAVIKLVRFKLLGEQTLKAAA